MGGSRSYSASSSGSLSVVVNNSTGSSGKPLSHKAKELVCSKTAYQRDTPTRIGESVNVMSSPQLSQPQPQPQPQPEVRSQRIICRCCLSEQQQQQKQSPLRPSMKSCPEQDVEDAPQLEFVPLDTLAMVDLRDENFIISQSADGDSYKSSFTRTSSTKGKKNNCTTRKMGNDIASSINSNSFNSTLLDCLNACARIGASLSDNELPQYICLDCCHTLEMCCEFIRCVRNADKILRRRCAQPAKRVRQQQLLHQFHQQQSQSRSTTGEEGPAAKRRRRCKEKVQEEHPLSVGLSYNTPKSISLPKSVMALAAAETSTSMEWDEVLDISLALDDVESSFVRSLDSGIEIDEDLCSVKSSDCSANENPIRCHLTKYEGYTYVVADTLSPDLERFHKSGRLQSPAGGSRVVPYKCGFCIFGCNVRQDLNKHLQMHLGPPQHSCRKCNFVGHFKFLLAQHMCNVHHCALESAGLDREGIASGCGGELKSPKYHCNLCSECFVNYDGLQQHRRSHKVFCKCTMCSFKSSTRENVLEHMAKEHKLLVEKRLIVKYIPLQRINAQHLQELTPTKSLSMSAAPKLTPKDNKYRKHLCQFCGKCFDRRFHLLKHEYGVHHTEIEQTTNTDVKALLRPRFSSYDASSFSNKFTKLKYLRQQRCIEDLGPLDGLQSGQDISSKFQCEICFAVFMFNFELKYHMRTHKISTYTKTTLCKELADKRISSYSPTMSSSLSTAIIGIKFEEKLSAIAATEIEEVSQESEERVNNDVCAGSDDGVDGEVESDDYGETENNHLKLAHEISNNMDTFLTTLPGDVDIDFMDLVVPQTSTLDSLEASPASSNNSFDINYDDQLYLNDFDLGLLDCNGAFDEF